MLIEKNFSIKNFNTFGINVYVRYFVIIKSIYDFYRIYTLYPYLPKIILGNGSNVLFLNKYFSGVVIKIEIKGIKIIYENDYKVIIRAFSGENWNDFVEWTIKKRFYGLENLSFIPGTIGASPIQNIGAYGVEIKNYILKIEVYEIIKKKIFFITKKYCKFSYRHSIFKEKNYNKRFLIVSVFFVLSKNKKLNLSYKDIRNNIKILNIKNPNNNDIAKIIFSIRSKKIPDPKKIGNAGSFFTNPIIKKSFYNKLIKHYPNIIGYSIDKNKIKVSANYLIEHTGWKGKRFGDVEIYKKQPIIIINYGKASGMDIFYISQKIIDDIKNKFGIYLSREVNIIGSII
ncbi:UDP-N-acetylmuramate dehydrogenase [Blattabacterium cuenoti]|uniref:UDP-N-acetylmuramate dehydrogenase n=1 Tax=Blattabacterium cuenoti TaxID=1653831 RepID=UPI00163C1109|nr:UDP-N-acetylmuramate dehydrogenase [Blattabacterium cuenoti]